MSRNPVSTAELFLPGHSAAQVGCSPGQWHPNPFYVAPSLQGAVERAPGDTWGCAPGSCGGHV